MSCPIPEKMQTARQTARQTVRTISTRFGKMYPKLSDLKREVSVRDDTWNGFKKSQYEVLYLDNDYIIASTLIRVATGQIGWINTIYGPRMTPLREEILFDITGIMADQTKPPTQIWEVRTQNACPSMTKDHTDDLYKKWGFSWKTPVHYTVSGSGYNQNLQHLIVKKMLEDRKVNVENKESKKLSELKL